MKNRQILSVYAENKQGVLSKITGLLRRKLFQIDSLTAGRTHKEGVSLMTIVIIGDRANAQKAAKMVGNMIEVLSVKVQHDEEIIVREIVLAKIEVATENKRRLLRGIEENVLVREISNTGNQVYIEIIDTSQALELFLVKLEQAEIKVLEWVRSGVIALEK